MASPLIIDSSEAGSQLTVVAVMAATSTKMLKYTVARRARSIPSKSFMARPHLPVRILDRIRPQATEVSQATTVFQAFHRKRVPKPCLISATCIVFHPGGSQCATPATLSCSSVVQDLPNALCTPSRHPQTRGVPRAAMKHGAYGVRSSTGVDSRRPEMRSN